MLALLDCPLLLLLFSLYGVLPNLLLCIHFVFILCYCIFYVLWFL